MEKLYEYTKSMIVNYKLDLCCWVVPVKVGVIFIGCFNIFVAIISLIGTANESFTPMLMKIQETLMEDYVTKPVPIVAYSAELGFSVLLLCAAYRKDLVLMYVYMRYCMATIIMSILVYSMVIAAVDLLIAMVIVLGVAYQCYVLLIVRSAIVEMKAEKRKYELPTLVTYKSGYPNQTAGNSAECYVEVMPSSDQEKGTQHKNGNVKDIKMEMDSKSDHVQKDGKSDDIKKKDEKTDDLGKKDEKSSVKDSGPESSKTNKSKTDEKNGKSDDVGKKGGKSDNAGKKGEKSDDVGIKNGKSDDAESVAGSSKKNKPSKKDIKKELKEIKLKTVEESPKE